MFPILKEVVILLGKVIAHYLKTKRKQTIESNKAFWSGRTYIQSASRLAAGGAANLRNGEIRLKGGPVSVED